MIRRIAIVEDDKLILDLVTNFLKSSGKFDIVAKFSDGKEFLDQIEGIQDQLDIILLDYKLGKLNAELILKELNNLAVQTPAVILTSHYNQHLFGYMVRAGAAAYLPKNIEPSDLINILEQVIINGHYISAEQFPFLKNAFSEDTPNFSKQVLNITEKDIEVIYLLANQLTAKEIATKLFVSPKTVDGYKNSLFLKTKTKSVVGLVLYAIQNGIINPSAIELDKDEFAQRLESIRYT